MTMKARSVLPAMAAGAASLGLLAWPVPARHRTAPPDKPVRPAAISVAGIPRFAPQPLPGIPAIPPRPAREEPEPLPRSLWRLEALFGTRERRDEFSLHVIAVTNGGDHLAVRPADLALSVRRSDGAPTPMRLVPQEPRRTFRGASLGSTSANVTIPLLLNRNGGPTGVYQLVANITADVRTTAGQPVRLRRTAAALDLSLPPLPDHRPVLAPGQRFLYLPHGTLANGPPSGEPFRNANGEPVPVASLVLRVLTLDRVEPSRGPGRTLWFHAESLPEAIRLDHAGADPTRLPNLYALLEDDALREARAFYEGRRVWGLGWTAATGVFADSRDSFSFQANAATPFTVRRIYRIATAQDLNAGRPLGSLDSGGEFVAHDPLLVTLEIPPGVRMTGSAYSSARNSGVTPRMTASSSPPTDCLGYINVVADLWHLRRRYSLKPVDSAHPEWPEAVRQAIRRGRVEKGMTPEMVTWAVGWPSVLGNLNDLSRLESWPYDTTPPFHFWVHFQNGRVTGSRDDTFLP